MGTQARRVPAGAAGAVGGLLRARARRSAARGAVRSLEGRLRPGRYVMAGDSLWRHHRAEVPEHLRLTKGRTGTGPGGGVRAAAARTARAVVLPSGFRARGGPPDGFSLAVATYDGGVLLLDPDGGRVARTVPPGGLPAGYAEMRERFGAHLSSPTFEVVDGGSLVVESFVPGRHLLDLPAEEQVEALRRLLRATADLTAAEGGGTCAGLVRAAVEAAGRTEVPGRVAELLSAVPAVELAGSWPLVPTATDATVRNLLVQADGTPVPIDLGEVRLDPFVLYPVGMVANARPAGLSAYLAGELDPEVAALFGAAGGHWPLTGDGREALLALRVCVVGAQEAGAPGTMDDEQFTRAVARRWANLWSSRPVGGAGAVRG